MHRLDLALALGVIASLLLAPCAGRAAEPARGGTSTSLLADADPWLSRDLADLTLEELGDLVVTSVLRRDERLGDTPASIFVITAEDIRRSGATTLPQVLRLAPNLNVARADANQWAITARSFNSVLANKLLVLIDGRTVYSPLFSGTFWEAQDIMLDDIERVEVVSGPGGASWGTNAVNGVINVVTRSAAETHGALVKAGTGNVIDQAAARYGMRLGGGASDRADDGANGGASDGGASDGGVEDVGASRPSARVWAKFSERAESERGDRTPVGDESVMRVGGVRVDWAPGQDAFLLDAAGYSEDIDQGSSVRDLSGVHALARWERPLGTGSNLEVQAYYDRTNRDQPGAIDDALDTWDFEAQHTFHPFARHEVTWGGSYRYQHDALVNVNPPALAFIPDDRVLRTSSVFAEDGFQVSDVLRLDAGVRAERNEYTGWEFLPTARVSVKPGLDHLFWTSLARVVRAPSRVDRELFVPGTPPFALAGGPSFDSEVANVAELGYRGQMSRGLAFSITGFVHEYDDLRSLELGPNGPEFRNGIHGTVRGAEGWLWYRPTESVRLSAGGAAQRIRLAADDDALILGGTAQLGNDPPYWFVVGAAVDAGPRLELDGQLRKVAPLPEPLVPDYVELDLRAAYWLTQAFELSVSGRNLFERSHPEWGVDPVRAEVARAVFVQLRWRSR
jgi:iron complex outermembrane receptor protein